MSINWHRRATNLPRIERHCASLQTELAAIETELVAGRCNAVIAAFYKRLLAALGKSPKNGTASLE